MTARRLNHAPPVTRITYVIQHPTGLINIYQYCKGHMHDEAPYSTGRTTLAFTRCSDAHRMAWGHAHHTHTMGYGVH